MHFICLSNPQIFCGFHVIANMAQMKQLANQGQNQELNLHLTELTIPILSFQIFFFHMTSKLIYEVYAFHFQIIKMINSL